jgi:hypothetical protein
MDYNLIQALGIRIGIWNWEFASFELIHCRFCLICRSGKFVLIRGLISNSKFPVSFLMPSA